MFVFVIQTITTFIAFITTSLSIYATVKYENSVESIDNRLEATIVVLLALLAIFGVICTLSVLD
ncbi:MAG: hypothetical protein E6053_08000 [Finegoldia magna]|uniref:hypothetical protein n=1 Tax=Finegoldia magna TaxID=1260 RepID=UPI00291253C1|nr:hypothetical protein [Finegoldia magna]MDU5527395.1 hypothetical protein [Finegoldia magna]